VLLARVVKVTVVSGGKSFALLGVLLLLLPLIADSFNCLLCILLNSRIACIRTLDDINAVLERGPWVRSATPVATYGAAAGRAAGLVETVIPTLVIGDGLLSLAGIYLGGECLTSTKSLTSDCPDDGVLRFRTYGGLEHVLKRSCD